MKIFLQANSKNETLAERVRGVGKHFGPSGLQILATRSGQTQDAIDLEYVTVVDRKNQVTTVSFSATCEYSDVKDAEKSIISRVQMARQGTLYLGAQPTIGNATYYKIENAFMESIHGVQNGVSVTWHYRFRGGQILET
ncbi:MAG: hypothetical protein EOM20_06735 [Spartobacteria bacterium]|nr:hypothetical protein [Spartobacteria bacterium]